MKTMFKKNGFNYKEKLKKIYFSKNDLQKISSMGNIIGLHSHNHPTSMNNLSYEDQKKEFILNKKVIEKIIKKEVFSASHPSGKYNSNTLKILKDLKIKIAFRDNIKIENNMKEINNSNLEISRKNHTDILKNII